VNLPLFQPPAVVEPPIDSQSPAVQQPDVLRAIEHKAGPFRELRDGQLTGREFRILELRNGFIVMQFADNRERRQLNGNTAADLDHMIKSRTWREVSA